MKDVTNPSRPRQESGLFLIIEGKRISFEELKQLPEGYGRDFGPFQVVNLPPQADRYRLIKEPTRTARP